MYEYENFFDNHLFDVATRWAGELSQYRYSQTDAIIYIKLRYA